ncbi:carboxymuconolactone decarboxylase family protein [Caballeronia novacaledonica]|uniref:Carboxymuconolactone decarboxylase family protein n=1 Tax=Caballeronia novacaledonica TaxID=1544861 RepID=A0AA37MJI9_9BURK|nr:carboxymuconolactone decarboxylase family protein [Caballeronia novacaledonica]GJH30045.1 carboxymuconolactone decarboxylase family protein [Caballeronia novacaledonica]
MSRIATPAIETVTGAAADIYSRIRKNSGGRISNTYAALGYLVPASLAAVLDAQETLNAGSLSRQEHEIIKLIVSVKTGCELCVAAHSYLGEIAGIPVDTLRAIRAQRPTGDAKRDALVRFVSHLCITSGTISDDEFTAIRAAGYTDIQLAEISLTFALGIFTNTFNRINRTDVDFPAVE